MTRSRRLTFAAALIAGTAAGVVGITFLSSGSSGPLTHALAAVGAAAGSLEHALRRRISGPGRSARLEWFAHGRQSAEWLRAPDRILLGVFDDGIPGTLDGVTAFEDSLQTTLPLIQLYTAWGDKPDQQFPTPVMQAIHDLGSTPLVTWEPWLADFDARLRPHLPLRTQRDLRGLAAVARGDYDFYIDAWAADAASFGHPILLRFGHEMNDPYRYPWGPQNNSKEEFIAAWRHVVARFRALGATNVLWVWSPHVAYEYWELYYPGSDAVDWVATGALNFGPIAVWSKWWSFDEIFGSKYPALARFAKPVMVAELGSLGVGGDRTAWYRDALADLPKRFPAVRSVVFFNVRSDQTTTYQKVDWTVSGDSSSTAAIRESIRGWSAVEPVVR